MSDARYIEMSKKSETEQTVAEFVQCLAYAHYRDLRLRVAEAAKTEETLRKQVTDLTYNAQRFEHELDLKTRQHADLQASTTL